MSKKDAKIHIIGAGISGLISAKVLEDKGYSPVVFEATDRVGGRVKTDIVEGFQLDHGFQVLLSNYPAAQKFLDYNALNLQQFKSGSVIFVNGKQKTIGDPLRDASVLFATLFSGIGNLADKLKILKLNKQLKKKSIQEIFMTAESTTKQYLKDVGFSADMIKTFFQPFFTGIFLETELQTSSRMFEFVFKMFGEGYAVLPKGGIEEISKQLRKQLQKTTFHFNTKVASVTDLSIVLDDGEKHVSDFTIVASEASHLIQKEAQLEVDWKSCQNLYFTTGKRSIDAPFIGLITNKDSLINNIFYHTSLPMEHQGKGELLSVTVVKDHQLSEKELVSKVTKELKDECGIEKVSFLKMFDIPKALPNLNDLKYQVSPSETQLTDRVFLAGDVQLNGSLNAAMLAGEAAALQVIEKLEK